jgi:cystathionine beta-lyase
VAREGLTVATGFDDVSLEALRARQSAKWATHPADVLPAWVAEMDFALAAPVREVLQAAVDADDCGYPHPARLGEAFAGFARDRYGWAVAPESVLLVPDVMVGVTEVLRAVTAPGDGIVLNPPVYSPFFAAIAEIGRGVVEAPLARGDDGWELDLDAVEQAFAEGARAYLLCNPHNPTGRVFSRAELERIAELSERYDVPVVSDEIHAPLTFANASHTPFGALGEEAAARAVTITSASKAWNLAGLKCAVLVPGAQTGTLLEQLPGSLRYHAGHLGVLTTIAAFEHGIEWLEELVAYLDGNRRLLRKLLAAHLPDVGYVPPEAGYLAWLDCRALLLGDDPAAVFLERGRVALSSGPTFGEQGRGYARLNFGTSAAILAEAVERMAAAL